MLALQPDVRCRVTLLGGWREAGTDRGTRLPSLQAAVPAASPLERL